MPCIAFNFRGPCTVHFHMDSVTVTANYYKNKQNMLVFDAFGKRDKFMVVCINTGSFLINTLAKTPTYSRAREIGTDKIISSISLYISNIYFFQCILRDFQPDIKLHFRNMGRISLEVQPKFWIFTEKHCNRLNYLLYQTRLVSRNCLEKFTLFLFYPSLPHDSFRCGISGIYNRFLTTAFYLMIMLV